MWSLKMFAESFGKGSDNHLVCEFLNLHVSFMLFLSFISLLLKIPFLSILQIKENMKALDVIPLLTPDVIEKIEAVVQSKPKCPESYR